MNAHRWAMRVLVVSATVTLCGLGCARKVKLPKEADVSGVPTPVIESFRREKPNSIILSAESVSGKEGPEWRILEFTPRYAKKTSFYNADGDKLRGW